VQGTFRELSGNFQGTFRELSGTGRERAGKISGNVQGTFRECAGNIEGLPSAEDRPSGSPSLKHDSNSLI
jgi:hypothetical protein